MIRLNRYIASCTSYSRRQAEGFIRRGEITINNKVVTDLATQVNINDVVKLNNKILAPLKEVYYIVNKPVSYTCTVSDRHADKLVTELVPDNPPVFPVGRLDKDSRGLIIMTNNGDLAQKITHPKFIKDKEYIVNLDKKLTAGDIDQLKEGIKLEQGVGKFDSIDMIANNKYKVIIHQGLKRQIREMLRQQGYRVKDLVRIRVADIRLLDLEEGKYRQMSKSDIMKLI